MRLKTGSRVCLVISQVFGLCQNLVEVDRKSQSGGAHFVAQRLQYLTVDPVALEVKILTALAVRTEARVFEVSADLRLVKLV